MPVSTHASGTQSATVTTEHSLATSAQKGVFTFHVDTNAMLDGDVLVLRIKQKALSGGAARVVDSRRYYGAQDADDQMKRLDATGNDLTAAGSLDFTLQQTHGTSRNFPWKVIQYT